MKKSFLNLNINKEDTDLNDYLVCWDSFGQRPNKTTILSSFKSNDFQIFLEKFNFTPITVNTEIFPLDEDALINRKIISKLNDDIFISYTEYDIEQEDSLVNEVHIIHKEQESEEIDTLIGELFDISEKLEGESLSKEVNSYILNIGPTGFESNPIPFLESDQDNFDLYYNDDVLTKKSKIEKTIKKNKKGLTIVHGERGVGKSTLVYDMISKLGKKSIFIPCSLFETTINNPEFRNFLKSNSDSVLILDDSEIYFSEIYSKSNIFTNNLLQLIDGLDSDNLKLHIFVILNVDDIEQVDHILLDSNNLLDIIEVTPLDSMKSKELAKHLGKKIKGLDL